MIVDSDILIWYLRGNTNAAEFLRTNDGINISAVSYMELVQGMRNANELRVLRKTLSSQGWKLLPITEAISSRAMAYVEEHFLSHAMQMADALIAASCVELGEVLATGNVKHYRPVRELVIKPFRTA